MLRTSTKSLSLADCATEMKRALNPEYLLNSSPSQLRRRMAKFWWATLTVAKISVFKDFPIDAWRKSILILPRYGHSLHFFSLASCKKKLVCLEGKTMTPDQGGNWSFSFLPETLLSCSQTVEGLFELTIAPLMGPRLSFCIACRTKEKQGNQ